MQHYSIPVTLLHYDTSAEITGKLVVSIPKYKFTQSFEITMVPQDIRDSHLAVPHTTIDFIGHTGQTPYIIELTYYIDSEHSSCVIFEPTVSMNIDTRRRNSTQMQIKNVPIRVMNLKHNNQEISKEISGLSKEFNFRSWVNVHLKNLDNLKLRLYNDLKHHVRTEKNLNML